MNPDTGDEIWISPAIPGTGYRSSFMGTGRIFLLQKLENGSFRIDAFMQDTGELYKTISYDAGELIDVLQSEDKLVFMHREGSEDDRLVKFLLYYTSLNPIRIQTIRESRTDQPFSVPVIGGNLLIYAGRAYSVFDGNTVWSKDEQMSLVNWVSDDYKIYIWDESGKIAGWDRLTGSELWTTPLNVLPPASELGPNHGGASMTILDGRLFIATPGGELIRVNTETGEPYPGIIKVSQSDQTSDSATHQNSGSAHTGGSVWIWVVLVLAVGFVAVWLFVSKSRTLSDGTKIRRKD
ncbi:MAG: PQQ-binding-like beta-propeller repeat protein [bacterium]|nr:PQQ-binding-like beta-propeller repeat protein [bacterium]